MVQIKIQAPSSAVMSRMRNGHPVRMKPHCDGEGLTIDVAPETYDAMTRSFRKGKATQIALRPDEIQGSGFFDSASKMAKSVANSKTAKDFAKKKADEAIEYATRMAEESGYVPKELTQAGNKYAKQYANKTIERGVGLGGGLGGALSPAKLEALNQLTGQRMGFLSHANRGLALAGLENDKIAHGLATARGQHGTGLYAQSGAHPMGRSSRTASHGLHEMGSVGKGGNIMCGSGLPPALTSQPASQNFQWGSRLPVAYQHISQTGKGLYG